MLADPTMKSVYCLQHFTKADTAIKYVGWIVWHVHAYGVTLKLVLCSSSDFTFRVV